MNKSKSKLGRVTEANIVNFLTASVLKAMPSILHILFHNVKFLQLQLLIDQIKT